MMIRMILPAVVAVCLLGGCGGSGGSSNSSGVGSLTIGLTDATVDMVDQVRIYVTGVTVKRDGAPPESFPVNLADCTVIPGETEVCNPVNLLSLQDGNVLTVLADQALPAGRYQWLRLDVDSAAAYIIEDDGAFDDGIEVRVPSERGLQLSGGFVILADETTDLVLDWDVRQGLTNPVGQEGYILKPSIRVTDMSEYGTVAGSVADGLMMNQCSDIAVVYVFDGDLIPEPPADPAADLDDIENNEPNPLVTATVNQRDNGSYGYEVNFLPVGTYTVALVCEADAVPASDTDLDEADDVLEFINPQIANVEDGLVEEINF